MPTNDKVTLRVKQGDTTRLAFTASTVTDGVGTPLDLTLAVVEFAVAERPGRSPNWSWSSAVHDGHVSVTDPAAGKVTVNLLPADSRAWGNRTRLVWELTVTFASGERLTLAEGQLLLDSEVVTGA